MRYSTAFTTTTVAPTGVENSMDRLMPITDAATAMTAEAMMTFLKLENRRMAVNDGKTIRADVRRAPTRFMANTIIIAVITAISRLYSSEFMPVAYAKVSSKVTANILLYMNTNMRITMTDMITQRIMSV